jgi:phospholipid/cholesterol/gamma-HCH transport system permease protein
MNAGHNTVTSQPADPATGNGEGSGRRPGRLRTSLENAADMAAFGGLALRSLGGARRYGSEVLRQTGIVILSSGLVIWLMEFVIGAVFAVQGNYISSQFGAKGYVGVFPALGGLRATAPEMWGWILSAKVGCGLVAEIGSMRISEEIDALEVMGIPSKPYLVGTRLLAAWIAMPFLYLVGLAVSYVGSWLVIIHMLDTVSEGGFFQVFWAFQSPIDLLFSMLWMLTLGTLIVLVGCYFGYTAKGGPVGVGLNTARSMVVNMVLVSAIGMFCQQLFWGGFPNAPIGN